MQCAEQNTDIGKVEVYSGFDHEEWLKLRHEDVTASKIGALFGCHPYATPLQLYAEKIQLNPPSSVDSGILRRGRWFEAAAIKAARELRPGWEIEEPGIYLRDAERGIGATPDAIFTDDNGECGVMQIKTVSKQQWRDVWCENDEPEAPLWVALQAMTEAALGGYYKAVVAPLVVDEWAPELHILELDIQPVAYASIAREVTRFWHQVDARQPPAADYLKDVDTLSEMYEGKGPALDLTGDIAFGRLLDEKEAIDARRNAAIEDAKAIKGRIIQAMRDSAAVTCGGRIVTYKEISRAGYSVQPATYRRLRISKRNKS